MTVEGLSIEEGRVEVPCDGKRCSAPPGGLKRRRFAALLAVGLPELGSSVNEACVLPLLVSLQIPSVLLALNWAVSPSVGLFMHPVLGRLTDRFGRRPFVIAFGSISICGLALLPVLVEALDGTAAIVAVVLASGVIDTSMDLLLTPTRAAMNDVYNADDNEMRCATAGGVGRVIGTFSVVAVGHRLAFPVVAGIIFCVIVIQLLTPEAAMSSTRRDESTPQSDVSLQTTCSSASDLSQSLRSSPLATTALTPCSELGSEAAGTQCGFPPGFFSVWALTAAGWIGVCELSIGSTSGWAERSGSLGTPEFEEAVHQASLVLMCSTVVFLLSGAALPTITRFLGGHVNALVSSLLAMAVAMLAFFPLCPTWATAACLVALVPPSFQVVANASFGWLEEQPDFDPSQRGRLIGCLNSSLALAQMVTSICTGPVVAATGGRIFGALVAAAVVCATCAVIAMIRLTCRRARAT
mmetsp:Transcript_133020/g.384722  ORF Transcript_133020/g.384722 Transcript_133020/m.384722 type:complete len:468 (-) Transcript_133020:381-1784(-)